MARARPASEFNECPSCGEKKTAKSKLCRSCHDASTRLTISCEQCGKEFTKQKSDGKTVCSIKCRSDRYSRRPRGYEWSRDLIARTEHEYRLRDELIEDGWRCARTVGGRGPFDLIAYNDVEVRLIQVKSSKDSTGRLARGVCVLAAMRLISAKGAPGVSKWIYVWLSGRGWVSICIDEWPNERRIIATRVREALAA